MRLRITRLQSCLVPERLNTTPNSSDLYRPAVDIVQDKPNRSRTSRIERGIRYIFITHQLSALYSAFLQTVTPSKDAPHVLVHICTT